MKNLFFVFLSILIISTSVFYSGCGTTSSDNGSAVLKGVVRDSATGFGIAYANIVITSNSFTRNINTDSTGFFICQDLETDTYTLTIKANGYFPKISSYLVPADDTLFTNINLLFTNIYIYPSLDAEEYIVPQSSCALDLAQGVYLPATSLVKDIQLMDTAIISGDTTIAVFFKSSDLDTLNTGKETKFSPLFASIYSQSQFDSLFSYPGFSNNLDACYPNKKTEVININSIGTVYAFYLKGKSNGFLKPIFGLIRIGNVGIRNGTGLRFVTVSIKINKNGENSFNPNPQKKFYK
jgi:hypothetical protein